MADTTDWLTTGSETENGGENKACPIGRADNCEIDRGTSATSGFLSCCV